MLIGIFILIVWFGLGLLAYGALKGYWINCYCIVLDIHDEMTCLITMLLGPIGLWSSMFVTEFFSGGFVWRATKRDYSRKSKSNN